MRKLWGILSLEIPFFFLILWTCTAEDGCRDTVSLQHSFPAPTPSSKFPCYCLSGNDVVKCACDALSLDHLNDKLLHPRLMTVLKRNFFRYFKVNLQRECPFWHDDGRCSIRDCAVKTCTADELPVSLRDLSANTVQEKVDEACAQEERLSSVDTSLNAAQRADVGKWDTRAGDENFCVLDDEFSQDCCYIDLLKNPERYTGYTGPHANRIWRTIYEENCFQPSDPYSASNLARAMVSEACLEKKVFFRLISGLHSSISIHLCAEYLHASGRWGPNLQEFLRRFDDALTEQEGTHRISNLYFAYSVLVRAIAKAARRFRNEQYFTGDVLEDEIIRADIQKLLDTVEACPNYFDETKLFCGEPAEARRLKEEFRLHFRNISRIMDCVGCEKCRLWGKLQTQGMGTALKILFTEVDTIDNLKLKRSEVVSLWNAFGRLSSSMAKVQEFRILLEKPVVEEKIKFAKNVDVLSFLSRPAKERSEL
ncbi:ERO1-like protein alpha [Paramacrobiotus metropolitanus]|uniref:ERO1-like protein alpha n=1 Tax=Paramacrobiotus metropolitanus TaxID=2943436 RepID=UPI002445B224|nr:ERO1-like protein alpha [Paramacrobiotus metropolitanus]